MTKTIDTPNSSNIASVTYDYVTQELLVEFKSGGIYTYQAVPDHLFEAFGTVSSAGKHFCQHIKNHFKFTRISKAPSKSRQQLVLTP